METDGKTNTLWWYVQSRSCRLQRVAVSSDRRKEVAGAREPMRAPHPLSQSANEHTPNDLFNLVGR